VSLDVTHRNVFLRRYQSISLVLTLTSDVLRILSLRLAINAFIQRRQRPHRTPSFGQVGGASRGWENPKWQSKALYRCKRATQKRKGGAPCS